MEDEPNGLDLAALDSATTCRIGTIGRRTGTEHEVTVWFARAGTTLYVPVRHGARSDWLLNGLAAGEVTIGRGRSRWRAAVRVVDDPQELGVAIDALAAHYARHRAIVAAWRRDPPTIAALTITA